ncbi:MAG: hypothetical protein PF517_05700 [Salinivirgaceae bacterium]|jgi:outer membrane lipoprotein-sorting protein|nr:hypothetical protein [Salinivirgaceae bacterium]
MKKLALSIACFIMATIVFGQTGARTYFSKSGKFAYRYEMGESETSYILIFDDFGKKQAFELVSNVDGYAQKTRTIITAENIFIINYEDKQVIKFPVDTDDKSMEMFGGADGGIDLSELVAEVSGVESAKAGTGVVLGKTCDIYEYTDPTSGSKGKYWIYKEYLFKAEFLDDEGQHAFMEVVDFKLDVAIDAKEFAVPSDFEVTDMSQMMQMQQMYGIPADE